ncbi:hypothetical protein, partial [Streptomyces varsoviensis]|uniref:hypothetical protein n=1 Tax=Streptomyces varsoviensis TaxID=67373 RepID=UPI0037B0714A
FPPVRFGLSASSRFRLYQIRFPFRFRSEFISDPRQKGFAFRLFRLYQVSLGRIFHSLFGTVGHT